MIQPIRMPVLPMYDNKVLVGSEGWLFIDNDSNQTFDQHTGKLKLEDKKVRQWRALFENRLAWLEKRGIQGVFIISPDKHSIYPEMVPDYIKLAEWRCIHQIMHDLFEKRSFATPKVIYPLWDMAMQKPAGDLYPKTESHWNMRGAYVAYRKCCEALGLNPLTEGKHFRYVGKTICGDLGEKFTPGRTSETVDCHFHNTSPKVVYDNRIINNGRYIIHENPDSKLPKAVIVGTSSSEYLAMFFRHHFRILHNIHSSILEHDFIEKERPDYVINVLGERFMVEIPKDFDQKTWDIHEKEKKELGRTL